MPLFKNVIAYRIGPDWTAPATAELESLLAQLKFIPCGPTQEESAGWVSPRPVEHAPMVESNQHHLILRIMVERKSVPSSVLNAELATRCKLLEKERGRAPGRKEKKDLKDEIYLELLPRAFSKKASYIVWVDPVNRLLMVGTGSVRAADQVVNHLVHVMATLKTVLQIAPLSTAVSPATAMAEWLLAKEAPEPFSLDRDLELRQPDSEKAIVRYSRHNLDIDEIAQHIESGKQPTQLALTWDARVSFVLTSELVVRKLDFLQLKTEGTADEAFDADAALATGELALMLPDLISALGGDAAPAAEQD